LEQSGLAKSREKLQAIKDKVEETKKKAVELHDQARNGASRREATERAMVQPAPPEGTVTTFGPSFAENEKISFSDGLGRAADDDTAPPEEVTATEPKSVISLPPVEASVEVPEVEAVISLPPVKPPIKKAAKKTATKRAKRAPAKKAPKKSK
jgi:hypothetical protein